MKLARHLQNLESRGYIKRKGGTRYTGFEYQIVSWKDYEQLQQGIKILDTILEKLKEKELKKQVTSTT
jgi:predicted transcriptional regulator